MYRVKQLLGGKLSLRNYNTQVGEIYAKKISCKNNRINYNKEMIVLNVIIYYIDVTPNCFLSLYKIIRNF